MGDPKKPKKRFVPPKHPWQATRMEEERKVVREYGLKNKKEIWRQATILRYAVENFKKPTLTQQQMLERKQLIEGLQSLGILAKDATGDDILALGVRDVLERRLQTVLVRRSLARSMKQARQFITHRHIKINGKIITSPSYLVSLEEQSKIEFIAKSPLADDMHPERHIKEQEEAAKVKEETKSEAAPQASQPEVKSEEVKEASA